MILHCRWMVLMSAALSLAAQPIEAQTKTMSRSHAPMRPLPQPSDRPLATGPSFFIDPINGDDRSAGTKEAPWKTTYDVRLERGSPTIDVGVKLPAAWPDLLRGQDAGKPDLGALPLGIELFPVGVR